MTARPEIDCIVPVFNGEAYIAGTLDSVLAQTWRPRDVLVVDDGSTDGTARIVAGYAGDGVRCIRQANAGPVSARNHGVAETAGPFVAFLDADDLWLPEKLERQMAWFDDNPEAGILSSFYENFWIDDLKEEEAALGDHLLTRVQTGFNWSGAVVRRETLERLGPFNPEVSGRESVEWLARAKRQGVPVEVLPEVLYRRRIHHDNLSRKRHGTNREDMLGAVRAAMKHRREADGKS